LTLPSGLLEWADMATEAGFQRVTVLDTGAVGGWYGGRLALAGAAVTLVTRHGAEAITAGGGLELLARGQSEFAPVRAVADPAAAGPCDLVVITLKATANPDLGRLLAPLLGPATVVLTLQNGMGNVELLEALLPRERIVAGLCFVCINRRGPACVESLLPGYIAFAAGWGPPSPAAEAVAAQFAVAGVKTRLAPSLAEALWRKLCWNVPFNGLAIAGGGITTDRILASPPLRQLAIDLMAEVQAAALAADGVAIEDRFLQQQIEVTEPMGPYRPSSLIDYLDGREVEVEAIWGEPARRAQAAGVAVPRLDMLASLLRHLVAQRLGNGAPLG